ncbi:orotidine-5'-phosphate decarboxylase [Cryobacterium sp. PH29-G1]|uniref:orotidine-5'-phosphate decarboxylase n=1 Tax=Cryobacterium sp. PH29-G1 TaxID=3046211 RepID=UPI0024B93081|nr:orotidine-5'-phosphate decarboxylase [Cryobacterium sp. PH29-G1]MDJ0350377.1 orotidine-5'-phosphate decarboxylase [Cryobacterium sp. PH29-G1]
MTDPALTGAATAAPGTPVVSFGERLSRVFAERGQLCVGIDPHSWLLRDWNLPDTAAGAEAFGRAVIAAAAGRVGVVKPQVAFYERFGSAGFVALERVLADARQADLLVIGDAKRGDLGTSAQAYAEAWLSPGSPLEVDALTLAAYMGVGSLDSSLALAAANGKGIFVLAATSNPEAADIQRALVADGPFAGSSVARAILDDVGQRNAHAGAASVGGAAGLGAAGLGTAGLGSIGVVLGATLDLAAFGIDVRHAPAEFRTPVLAPGFGHQGGNIKDLAGIYGGYAGGVIVSESRSVLSAGPRRIEEAIERRVAEVGTVRG